MCSSDLRERKYQEAVAHKLDLKQAHGASYGATSSRAGNGSGFRGHKLSLTAAGVARHGAPSPQKASTRRARGHSGAAQEPAIARRRRPRPPRRRTSLDSLPRPGGGARPPRRPAYLARPRRPGSRVRAAPSVRRRGHFVRAPVPAAERTVAHRPSPADPAPESPAQPARSRLSRPPGLGARPPQ